MERLTVKPADNDFFSNLEASQHNSEYDRLYEGRIDQGRIPEPVGKMQLLGSEHDLCKRKGADQGNSVACKINVMLGENQGLIGDEQSEHNIEVESHYEVLSHLVDDFLLQRLLAMTHGIFSLEAAFGSS